MVEFMDGTGRIVRCVSKESASDRNADEILLRLLKYAPASEFMSTPCITQNNMTDAEKAEKVKGYAGADQSGGKIPESQGQGGGRRR